MTRERWAQVGIVVQFLALIRGLAEILRLHAAEGAAFTMARSEAWVVGALIAAALTLVAVLLVFLRRPGWSLAVSVLTVVVLLVYKGLAIGF